VAVVMKRAKILLISPDASLSVINKTPIGAAIVLASLEPQLATYGYQTECWSPQAEGLSQFLKNIPRLMRRVHQADADLIHLFLMTPSLAWVSSWVGRTSSAPVLTTFSTSCHEGLAWLFKQLQTDRAEFSWYLFKFFAYHPLWIKATSDCADKLTYSVSSQFQVEQLVQWGFPANRVYLTSNMTDLDKSRSFPVLSSPNYRIGFMGHFTPAKGWDILLKAFEQVAAELKEAELFLAWSGRGNLKSAQSAIQSSKFRSRITLTGVVDRLEFLSQIKLLVQPYRHLLGTQLYPNTLLEAISVGVPLITTNLKPLDELLKGEAACLVEPGNVSALAQAMIQLYQNPALQQQQLTAQQALASNYSAGTIAEAYHKMYHQIIHRGQGDSQSLH
jgi:glycosyltransferase involved in cell wall biosynthesis